MKANLNPNQTLSEEDVVVDKRVRPPTPPVAAAESKTIEATVADCPSMNYLLQRFEMGESLDLSKQLEILENDSHLCSLGYDTFGSCSTPNANEA
mmetsp:Transcript_1694/g.3957  ORF Transcript_1694/g.3957 Transcript_1694/m.3957 type:complete len:95 (+) Transcript_1694:64-348(+)